MKQTDEKYSELYGDTKRKWCHKEMKMAEETGTRTSCGMNEKDPYGV